MPPRNPQQSYRWVSARLRERIEAGEFIKGQQLPNLRELAVEYGVSLATARKAVQALADAGLVEVYPGWGVFRA
jgi:DNA-binding GntR family transcriptional regulator